MISSEPIGSRQVTSGIQDERLQKSFVFFMCYGLCVLHEPIVPNWMITIVGRCDRLHLGTCQKLMKRYYGPFHCVHWFVFFHSIFHADMDKGCRLLCAGHLDSFGLGKPWGTRAHFLPKSIDVLLGPEAFQNSPPSVRCTLSLARLMATYCTAYVMAT